MSNLTEWAEDWKSKNITPEPIMLKIWLDSLADAIIEDAKLVQSESEK